MSALGEKGGIFAVYFEQLHSCAVISRTVESGLLLEGVLVLSTLIGFNDPHSPGASTCPAQDPMSAPAPVMPQQGQSPDHHSLGPVSHPSPSLSPGMVPSAGAAPSAILMVAPGQSCSGW